MADDNWKNLNTFVCETCMYYVPKNKKSGRCRARAPTMRGWPVVYLSDWCGRHKIKS